MIRVTLISVATVCVLTFIGASLGTVINGMVTASADCERTALSIRCEWEW
jgi:hypothetical protein